MDRAKALGLRVAVFDTTGVIATSEGELRLSPEDIAKAAADQGANGTATVMAGTDHLLSAFVPLTSPTGQPLGYLYVGINQSLIDASISKPRLGVLRSVASAAALAALVAWAAALLAIRPIHALAEAARRTVRCLYGQPH